MTRPSNYRKTAGIYLAVFIVSTLLAFAVLVPLGPLVGEIFSTINSSLCDPCPPETTPVETDGPLKGGLIALAATVLTSVTSFVGFVSTTVIGWRKERREAALAAIEQKRLEMELEKSRLELERLKVSKSRKS